MPVPFLAALGAAIASPTVIAAIIGIFGLMFKNNFVVLLGVVGFLYFAGIFVDIPMYIWIVIIVIIGFAILNLGKGK